MLSFDQYHFTFHNLTEQGYVCNYFSQDGAKEGISAFTRVVSWLKTGIWSAITFLVQVHINILRGILWLHAFRKIYEQAHRISWLRKSLIFSYWNRGQVVWFFTSTVKSRKKASLQRRRVQLTKEIRQRVRFKDSWFCRRRRWSRWSSSSGSSLRNVFTIVKIWLLFQNMCETPSTVISQTKPSSSGGKRNKACHVSPKHARISELKPESTLLESVLSRTYLRCARITESHCLPLFR